MLISALSTCPAGCDEAPGWDLEKSLVTLRSGFFLSTEEKACDFLLYGEVRLLPVAFITIHHGPQLLHWRRVLAGGAQNNSVKTSEVLFGSSTQRAVMGKCHFCHQTPHGWSPIGVCFLLAPSHIDVQPVETPRALVPPGCWSLVCSPCLLGDAGGQR